MIKSNVTNNKNKSVAYDKIFVLVAVSKSLVKALREEDSFAVLLYLAIFSSTTSGDTVCLFLR